MAVRLARGEMLGPLYIRCNQQKTISASQVNRYLEQVEEELLTVSNLIARMYHKM